MSEQDKTLPLLRGGLIAVFVWILLQLGSSAFSIWMLLFGLDIEGGYTSYLAMYGLEGLAWPVWPVMLTELVPPVVLLVLNAWLLRTFLGRRTKFCHVYFAVWALGMAIPVASAAVQVFVVGELEPQPRVGTGFVVGFGVYQYLRNSPRVAAIFGEKRNSQAAESVGSSV